MTEVRPRPSVISSGAKQNREIPLHYAACLYCQERYSPHFCRIVCHLTPDSLKSPQISNPPLVLRTTFLHGKASQVASAPLRIVFACHPASGWYNQGSSNLKPQVSNLKPLPLRPSGRSLHYTGREPERPGGHSFIPRTRAFHGNGDGRAEAIT